MRKPDVVAVYSGNGCLLERSQLQDGHWAARLESTDGQTVREVDVLSSSQLKQAVYVPRGDWVVHFEYRPWWKWLAIGLSGFSWFTWLALLFPRSGVSQ